jgi:hypothetical protein
MPAIPAGNQEGYGRFRAGAGDVHPVALLEAARERDA